MFILGISAFYHDSAACIIQDGIIIAAAQEERFTRIKHDSQFPSQAISYCLQEANIGVEELSAITYYEKPFLKFERLIETFLAFAPKGVAPFCKAIPLWIKQKLFLKRTIQKTLKKHFKLKDLKLPPLLFSEHHLSHAASCFYASPFEEAVVLCLDGVGEWTTTSAWVGERSQIKPLWQIDFPHSLGLLYSAFTFYTGFKVNSGEYKLMGLAPYGKPVYVEKIYQHLIDVKDDGSFRLNLSYFDFPSGSQMTNHKFHQLFGGNPRHPSDAITQKEMDLARSIQVVLEDIILKLCRSIKAETGLSKLCLAGGVALNCVANGRLHREKIFEEIWIQPAAGDAGGAIGAALASYFLHFKMHRAQDTSIDLMKGAYLGPEYSDQYIKQYLDRNSIRYEEMESEALIARTVTLLTEGHIIGWFQGKMEFGPRALGNRSILGDPRNPQMQSIMNLKVKKRESFRPFAPAILEERVQEYFDTPSVNPYMMMTSYLNDTQRLKVDSDNFSGMELLKQVRSTVPAITHVDYSARLQTVSKKTNSLFHRLIEVFYLKTDCPMLINTSFNVRGEPIVCKPQDALACFLSTEIDYLIMGRFFIAKHNQNADIHDIFPRKNYTLD